VCRLNEIRLLREETRLLCDCRCLHGELTLDGGVKVVDLFSLILASRAKRVTWFLAFRHTCTRSCRTVQRVRRCLGCSSKLAYLSQPSARRNAIVSFIQGLRPQTEIFNDRNPV